MLKETVPLWKKGVDEGGEEWIGGVPEQLAGDHRLMQAHGRPGSCENLVAAAG